MEIHSFKPNCRWLSGPKFLLQSEEQWPVRKSGKIPDDDKEIRLESHVALISDGSSLDLFLRRCSSWSRLQTLMAWLLCFIDYIKDKNAPLKLRGISIEETRNSTQKIVQLVQRQYVPEEIESLSSGREVKGHSNLLISPLCWLKEFFAWEEEFDMHRFHWMPSIQCYFLKIILSPPE